MFERPTWTNATEAWEAFRTYNHLVPEDTTRWIGIRFGNDYFASAIGLLRERMTVKKLEEYMYGNTRQEWAGVTTEALVSELLDVLVSRMYSLDDRRLFKVDLVNAVYELIRIASVDELTRSERQNLATEMFSMSFLSGAWRPEYKRGILALGTVQRVIDQVAVSRAALVGGPARDKGGYLEYFFR